MRNTVANAGSVFYALIFGFLAGVGCFLAWAVITHGR